MRYKKKSTEGLIQLKLNLKNVVKVGCGYKSCELFMYVHIAYN